MRLRNRNELRGIIRPAINGKVGLVHLHEAYELAPGQVAIVARLGSRWFVMTGAVGSDYSTYEVSDPMESHGDALQRAYGMEVAL
jgi:hypothetical protein